MGIHNDAILCYGIEFSYDEIKKLKENELFKELAEDLDTDFMPALWGELGFISTSYYYDSEEEYRCYIIGKEIKSDLSLTEFLQEIDESELILYLKNVCDQYNLEYKHPKILCRPNVE